jgi:gliding motility-associated-like protein
MTYTCYVGGVCGFKQTLTKTVYVKTVPTVLINSGNPISNCGTQATALTASGANTYTWNTGPTTTSISVSPSVTTTYSVIGRASNGCTNTAVSSITVNPIPTFTISSSNTNTICSGQSTTLSVSGTASNYTWSPGGATTSSIVVSPGSTTVYNVTGRNAQGCTAIVPTTITVNSLPTVTSTSVTICSGNSGTLTAGGASSYSWTTGSALATTVASPTTTTDYTVIGTAANSCTNSAVGRITVNNLPTVTINSNNPVTICNGQTVTLSGGGAVTYTWNTGQTTNNINVSPTINTTYTVTGSAATGCSNTAVTTLTVNALPSLTVTGTNTICAGKSTTLTATGASTYNWMPGSINNSTISVSPAGTTVYTVIGTAANTCSNTLQHTVTVNALPTISVNNATVCNGSSVLLTGTGSSASYSWNTGANTNTVNVSPVTLTNYTVTGTAANTCTNSAVAQVSVIALPSISVASQTICLNQSINLTASGANSYTWSTTQNGNSISVSPTVTTTYSVIGTAISTCTNSTNATVTILGLPQLTSIPSIAPSNCSASTGSITNVTVSGAPVLTYTWTNSSATNVGSSPSLNNQPAGTYNLFVRDGNDCTNLFGPYSITNPGSPAAPSASATANSICVGQTINLFANGSGGTYSWSGPNGFTTTTQNPTITNATSPMSGVYSVFETVSGCSGPATNVSVTVNSLPLPNATTTQTLICEGNNLGLVGSSASTYTWSGPSSYSSNNQNPSITNVNLSASGIYTLSVTNSNGCVGTTTVNVTISLNPTPIVSSNPSFICAGETVTLSALGGTSYSWSGPNSFSNNTSSPTISNAGTLANGIYTVVVTGVNTCTTSAVTSVTVIALPTFTSSVNNANICYGATIQFNAGTSVNTYSWTGPNSFVQNNIASPSINNATPLNSGIYTVTAGGGSCASSQTISVNVYSDVLLTPTAVSTVICEDGTIQLQGNGGVSFQWNGPNSFSSINQNPSIVNASVNASGVYTLSVLDGNNCPGSNTVAILVNSNPTANANATSTIVCVGDNISLTATGGIGYSWLGPNGFNDVIQSPIINNSGIPNSGEYTVTVTDANLCSSAATVSVSVASLPTFTVSANALNVCFGEPIQLNAGSGSYVYNWTGPDLFVSNNNANPQIINTTPSNSGTYTVIAILGSCSATETITINVYPQLNVLASAVSHAVCSGSSVQLNGSGGGNYAWSGPDNFSSISQNPQIINAQNLANGIYTLTVTDITSGCTASDTVNISINQAPVFVNSSSDSTCLGGQLTLYADFGPNATVNWYSDAALTNLVQANANTYQPVLNSNGTYTYYVQGVVGTCVSSVQVVTGFYYNVNAIASADVYSGFVPLDVNFNGSNSQGVDNTDSFNWNFGDNNTSTAINPSYVYNTEGTYTVTLYILDNESGCRDTANVTIKVEDDLIVIVPNVFTPNGDNVNDGFVIKVKGAKSAEGLIYNRWGQLLYSWDVLNVTWDGKAANGENCPDATYYYLIKVIDKKNKEHLFPGYVLLIR